jgi:hypothetical protein
MKLITPVDLGVCPDRHGISSRTKKQENEEEEKGSGDGYP